jgi:hypothetical protein
MDVFLGDVVVAAGLALVLLLCAALLGSAARSAWCAVRSARRPKPEAYGRAAGRAEQAV